MNLIEIKTIGNKQVNAVSARDLYEKLGMAKSQFSRWATQNIIENTFAIEHDDFEGFDIMLNGNETTDYALSMNFAKKLAMQVKTEQGEKIRNYFLECEAKANAPKELSTLEILQIAIQSEKDKIAALAMVERKNQAIFEIERTKAHISNSREASVMGKLSAKTKQVEKLQEELGDSKTYKTVKAISDLKHIFELTKVAYQQIGRHLTKLSKSMGYEFKEIPNQEFGSVKIYHIDVIQQFKINLNENPDILSNYRKINGLIAA